MLLYKIANRGTVKYIIINKQDKLGHNELV